MTLVLSGTHTFSSYLEDSRPPLIGAAEVFEARHVCSLLVVMLAVATKVAVKVGKAQMRGSMKGNTTKWTSFLSTFILNKMCDLIRAPRRCA